MLISPPFLLEPNFNESDADFIARCMPNTAVMVSGTAVPEGSFPVSFKLGWHGGLHLQAPTNGSGVVQNIRAIADGEIVYVRRPTPQNTNPSPAEPRNYNPYGSAPAWTDDGCVVIRHTTDIGADAQNQAVSVTILSIYLHISELRGPAHTVATGGQNRRVYRKDEIGVAGMIYGTRHQLHFEIVCDDDNLQHLVSRVSGDLGTGTDGRADVAFGEMYFRLPAGTPFYTTQPMDNNPVAYRLAQAPASPTPLTATYTSTDTLYIGLRYTSDGAAADRGNAVLTTCLEDGTTVGNQPLIEADAEYNLYDRADTISNAYPAANRPAPSAVYELLRFGRVIGPDALNPADVPHWREVHYPGGQGWVNLNAAGVTKFSDADFPHWCGWKLIADDINGDSRCDSAQIIQIIKAATTGSLTRAKLEAQLKLASVRAALKHTVCKFPTELDQASTQTRWGWLATDQEFGLAPSDFQEFTDHVNALAIPWTAANTGLPTSHWHFEPREFVATWRKCGWLSLNELSQLMPRHYGSNANSLTQIRWTTAQSRFRDYVVVLNRVFRRFNILSTVRQTHFLAQTYIETAMWRTMREFGTGHQQRRRNGTLYWPAPAMAYYQAFYGRGVMQLTWAGNYEAYGNFRSIANVQPSHVYVDSRITHTSLHYWQDPRRHGHVVLSPHQWFPRYDPNDIETDVYDACDSGAYYWIWKNTGHGNRNINRVADQGVTTNAVGRTSVLVNGGGYGFADRQAYASFIFRYRGDSIDSSQNRSFNVTYGHRVHAVYVDFTPQRP